MKTKHTKGAVHVSACCPCQVKSESKVVVADTWYADSVTLEEAKANAERFALAWNLLFELPALLPDPQKLELLAVHFDVQDRLIGNRDTEIQDDLRKWASNVETILAKSTQPTSNSGENADLTKPIPDATTPGEQVE